MYLLVKNRTLHQQTLDEMAETQAITEFVARDAYKLTL